MDVVGGKRRGDKPHFFTTHSDAILLGVFVYNINILLEFMASTYFTIHPFTIISYLLILTVQLPVSLTRSYYVITTL